jgi:hypothetical protein
MKLKGIKQGKAINLVEELELDDGREILINLTPKSFNDQEKLTKIKQFLESSWDGKEDFTATMTQLELEKKQEWERLYGKFNP